jgi:hypothetical protein
VKERGRRMPLRGWEYTVLWASYEEKERRWKIGEEGGGERVTQALGRLGGEGWELVTVVAIEGDIGARLIPKSEEHPFGPERNRFTLSGWSSTTVLWLFLKRPIE